jgi:hypothetical protein
MLSQLLGSKPLTPNKSKTDEVVISDTDKAALDEAIAKRIGMGWRLRFRAYSAEGEHSATLFRPAKAS